MLNHKQVWSKPVGMHADKGGVPGLYLQVTGNRKTNVVAGRSWIFRYQLAGERREMGLGSLDDVGLAEARDLAREARRLKAAGIDPIEARKQEAATKRLAEARAVTFKQAAETFVKAREAEWSNPVHRAQWRSTLGLPREDGRQPGKHRKARCPSVIATIGSLPVAEVDTPQVMSCLQPLWDAGLYETCRRVRGRIEKVLDWAKVSGYRQGENPARWNGHISELLGDRNQLAPVRHHPAVPYEEIPALMTDLMRLGSVSAMALAFDILTGGIRTNAMRRIEWTELDLKAKLWTVPADRAKGRKANKREHQVPLSDQALAILNEMGNVKINRYVFPGQREGKPLSNMAMLECLRGARSELWRAVGDGKGPGFTTHGMRSTFKDWATDCTHFANIVSEAALQHTIKDKTERAYRRRDLLEKRRALMQAWADYLLPRGDKRARLRRLRRRRLSRVLTAKLSAEKAVAGGP